jgi:glycosyltransferase involved in cell wall biosynthesis
MRVLVYLEKADVRGGIEVFAERHVAQLRAAGHEVDVVHSPPAFNAYDEIIVHKCSDVATLEVFPPEKTTYYVHDHEPICPRTYAYTPLRRNCTRASGVWPCLFCAPLCRSWKAALARVFAQGRRKRAMARFKRIVVISAFMKGRLVANGLPAERIVVEPPARQSIVDSRQPTCDVRHATGATVDLLFVGQLVRGKGVQLLLEAMARMRTPRTLDVVGTGNMEARLKAQAERLGLAERVRWHGYQPNPQEWMRAAKCVVVPSFWQEPYGLVAAEAVALGRSVVAFDIGGLPEACQGKATLVPPGDVDALARALDGAGACAAEMV